MYNIFQDERSCILRAIQEKDGVLVAAVDSNGDVLKRGRIVKLLNDGRLLRFTDVDPKFVKTNPQGEILTTDGR